MALTVDGKVTVMARPPSWFCPRVDGGAVAVCVVGATRKDRVEGLGFGADHYLPKPFDFDEMEARVPASGRRPRVGRRLRDTGRLQLQAGRASSWRATFCIR